MFTKTATFSVCFWASVFGPMLGSLISIFMHTQAHLTDWDAVLINGEIVLISEMSGMAGIEVDKGRDSFPSAVFIDSISVMGGIEKEFFNTELWKVCFHGEKGMQKRKHIMPGSPFQKRKYGEVAVGIGCHIHVEVVTEEVAFPMGVPSPVAVWLGILAFAVTGRTAFFLAIADSFFSLLCGSPDRSAVTSKIQMIRI